MDITNAEQKYFVKWFGSNELLEDYLDSLLKEWKFVTIENVNNSTVIVKVIGRLNNMKTV